MILKQYNELKKSHENEIKDLDSSLQSDWISIIGMIIVF